MELKTIKILVVGAVIVAIVGILIAAAIPSQHLLPPEVQFSNLVPSSLATENSPVLSESGVPLSKLTEEELIANTEAEIEKYIYHYTNEERLKAGLQLFTYDPALQALAKEHSEDMAKNNYYEHDNLQGQTPSDRAIASGYEVYKELGNGWSAYGIGENIHMITYGNLEGVGYAEKYDAEKLARKFVMDWMESKGHRDNILNANCTNIGIGVKFDGKKWFYATQEFW